MTTRTPSPGQRWGAWKGARRSCAHQSESRDRGGRRACWVCAPREARPLESPIQADRKKASAPARSREQRLRALQHANEIRSARAQLKRDLASGTIELVELVA